MRPSKTRPPERVLLLHPPVYDTRLPWARWQQPGVLLKLGTYFRNLGTDVRLIDALKDRCHGRLKRRRVGFCLQDLQTESPISVPKWRYGTPANELASNLRALQSEGWAPDRIYVECFTPLWLEGSAEVIVAARKRFPQVPIRLVGNDAARVARALRRQDFERFRASRPLVARLAGDLSLYERVPSHYIVTIGNGRTVNDVVKEIVQAVGQGVRHLAIGDHGIVDDHYEAYSAILERLAELRLRVRLYALGNIAPRDLVKHPELPRLMKRAGYTQIFFADDRDIPPSEDNFQKLCEDYGLAAAACHAAGFPQRTDTLSAGICLGRPGEDLAERARLATCAHYVGAVIVWPYQPLSTECRGIKLADQNGKMFPLRDAHSTYRDYMDFLGLAAILNAKYREQTFDFLGDGLVANMFRDSVAREAWNPDPSVKGTLALPVRL